MTDEKLTSLTNPFRLVINTALFLLFFLLVAFFTIKGFQLFGPVEQRDALRSLLDDFLVFVIAAWDFIRPFIQLVIILAIVEWLLKRLGISIINRETNFRWTPQTVIAVIIIGAFSIAALGGVPYAESLKDIALVVVGFYFGSQKKITEYSDEKGRVVITEEHENEKGSGQGGRTAS